MRMIVRRVTRSARHTARRPAAEAPTSMTFEPSRRSTLVSKPPPSCTATRSPRTITRAPEGDTRPLTCTVASRATAPSLGAVRLSCTGGRGGGGGWSPHPAAVAASTAGRSRSERRTIGSA